MDHREPDRMGTAETAGSRRFARPVPAEAVRKLAVPRLVSALVAGVLGLLVLGAGVWYLGVRAVGWVRHQDEYAIPFRAITLEPPPPAWYRGGAPAFLDHVRKAAMIRSDHVPILDGDPLSRLRLAFQKSAWVQSVSRVEATYPNRLVVRLHYREPVAIASWERIPEFLLDREGVVLPIQDVDQEALAPLIRIELAAKPSNAPPGERLKIIDTAHGTQREDMLVSGAARLADFLRDARASEENADIPPISAVQIRYGNLYIRFEKQVFLRWQPLPGDEPSGTPDLRAKWTAVRDWFRDHGPEGVKHPNFLDFVNDRVTVTPGRTPAS